MKRFVPPCGRPDLLPLEWPRQREGHPANAPSGLLPSRFASRGLAKNTRASCARPLGLIVPSLPRSRGPMDRPSWPHRSYSERSARNTPFRTPRRLCAQSRVLRRATQSSAGERRQCLSAWMRELAPARAWRVAQGTALATQATRRTRVPFLLVTSLWARKEK